MALARGRFSLTLATFAVQTMLMLLGNILTISSWPAVRGRKAASWWAIGLSFVAMNAVSIFLSPLGGLAAARWFCLLWNGSGSGL